MLSTRFLKLLNNLWEKMGHHCPFSPYSLHSTATVLFPSLQAQRLLPRLLYTLPQQVLGCFIFWRLCTSALQLSLCCVGHKHTVPACSHRLQTVCSTMRCVKDHPVGFLKIPRSPTPFSHSSNQSTMLKTVLSSGIWEYPAFLIGLTEIHFHSQPVHCSSPHHSAAEYSLDNPAR